MDNTLLTHRFLVAIVCFLVLTGSVLNSPVFAGNIHKTKKLFITLDNNEISVDYLLRDKNNTLYIPAEYLSFVLGSSYTYSKDDHVAFIDRINSEIIISTNFQFHKRNQIIFNDDVVDLPHQVYVLKNDTVLIPLQAIADLMNMPLKFRRASDDIRVSGRDQAGPAVKQPVSRKKLKPNDERLKQFGFYLGLSHLKPEVEGLNLDRSWSLFGAARVRIHDRYTLEFRYDTFKSAQTTMFLGEQAEVTVKLRGLTGYLLYCFPRDVEKERWAWEAGLGLGIHRVNIYHDSDTMYYNPWDSINTFEIKVSTEYLFTEYWSFGLDVRGIFGNERIAMPDINNSVNVDLDGVFIAMSQRYSF